MERRPPIAAFAFARLWVAVLAGCLATSTAIAADIVGVTDPTTAPTTHAPMNLKLPTLFLIGDSTVRNGRDTGTLNQWGWGHPIANYFDQTKINVQNCALGGTSSRSFYTTGLWPRVLADIKPGDFLLIQFGTNDGGAIDKGPAAGRAPRASIKGNGEESRPVTMPSGDVEDVHSYGWYLRQYVKEARAKGATPIVLSLVPRNGWTNGKIGRADQSYGLWAKQAAQQEGVAFIDLNAIICDRYDAEGEAKVTATYYPSVQEHTHTNAAGADVSAQCVIAGIKALKDCPLSGYLLPIADKIQPASDKIVPAKTN